MTPTPQIAGNETARRAKGWFFETAPLRFARRAIGDGRPDEDLPRYYLPKGCGP